MSAEVGVGVGGPGESGASRLLRTPALPPPRADTDRPEEEEEEPAPAPDGRAREEEEEEEEEEGRAGEEREEEGAECSSSASPRLRSSAARGAALSREARAWRPLLLLFVTLTPKFGLRRSTRSASE